MSDRYDGIAPVAPPGSEAPGGGGGGGSPATPQPDPDPAPVPTPPPGTEASTPGVPPNASAGDNGGGGVLPDGWDLLAGALEGALHSFTGGVAWLVDQFNLSLLTIPAAGTASDPASWVLDAVLGHDLWWSASGLLYILLSAFVMPYVWAVGWTNVALPRGRSYQERLSALGWAVFFILLGFMLLQGWNHLWNTASIAFAPSGDEFMSTPGNTAKLGAGLILGAALLALKAIVILFGLLIHAAFVFLTYFLVACWPLSIALYFSGVFPVQPMGTSAIIATLLLGPLQFLKTLVLRFVFEVPLELSAPDNIVGFFMILIGVSVAFLGIPYWGAKNLIPHTIISAGGRAGRGGARDVRERAPSRQEIRERIETVEVNSPSRSRLGDRARGAGSRLRSRLPSRPVRADGGRESAAQTQTGSGGRDTRARTNGGSGTTYRSEDDYKW